MHIFNTQVVAETFRDGFLMENPKAADLLRIKTVTEVHRDSPGDFLQYFSLPLDLRYDQAAKTHLPAYTGISSRIVETGHPYYRDLCAQLHTHPDALIAVIRQNTDSTDTIYLVDPEPEELAVEVTKYYQKNVPYVDFAGNSNIAYLHTRHPEILDTLLESDDDFLPGFRTDFARIKTLLQERDPNTGRMRTIFP